VARALARHLADLSATARHPMMDAVIDEIDGA
jgi:hypothetical protein